MIQYSEALRSLSELAASRKMGLETVSLGEARGRVLGESLRAREDLPAFDNSAMDGFVIRFRELETAPEGVLPVSGRVIAGDPPRIFEEAGAVEIMTGAPIPSGGFDAVVKVEEVERTTLNGKPAIRIPRRPREGEHIRLAGSDFKAGSPVGASGERIDPSMLMGFAALGISGIPVRRKPRVRLLATGNELQEPGEASLSPGSIRNASSIYLVESLKSLGCEVDYLGIAGDEVKGTSAIFESVLDRALADSVDLLVTTGAVSMGVHDFIPRSIEEKGGKIAFHRVAIRPGKPILVSEFSGGSSLLLIGIPGNPVSSAVGFEFFLKPLLLGMLGAKISPVRSLPLRESVEKPEGLRCFLRGKREEEGIRALPGQGSFMIHSLMEAEAWIELPEEGSRFPVGTRVRVHPLERDHSW